MKNTLRSVFHSPRFLVGFIIFMVLLLTVLIYPYIVVRDPLLSLGKGFLEPGTYVSVYVLEPQAKSYLVLMLIFSAFYMFALSYNAMFTVGVFPAGGDSKYDAVSVFFATWCFSISLSLLGTFVFHWPVMVIYCVMCLDEIVKVPFIRPHYNRYIWLTNLTKENISGNV